MWHTVHIPKPSKEMESESILLDEQYWATIMYGIGCGVPASLTCPLFVTTFLKPIVSAQRNGQMHVFFVLKGTPFSLA